MADALGCGSVRLGFPWGKIEKNPDRIDLGRERAEVLTEAQERGLRVQTTVGYGNRLYDGGDYPKSPEALTAFGRFAGAVARETAVFDPLPEIWNEWNLGIGMADRFGRGEPEDYVPVLAEGYAAVKEVMPGVNILGGCMAGAGLTDDWTKRACSAGMLEHLDALSFHPYCYWMGGRRAMPETGMMELIERLEEVLVGFPGGKEVPFYLTEMGWPTHKGVDGVTLEEQAQYASRMLLLMRAHPRVRGVWWFNLNDRDSASEDFNHHFGLRFSDGTPKPSWFSFRDTAKVLEDIDAAELVDLGRGGVRVVSMTRKSGERVLAVWAVWPGDTMQFEILGLKASGADTRLMGSDRDFPVQVNEQGTANVAVGNMPVILRGFVDKPEILRVRRLVQGAARNE
ncbi:MAG: hypothetical protein WA771_07665 [Chthoniobacterales bacterium]